MGDTQVRVELHDHPLEVGQVLLGRFAVMSREHPVRIRIQGDGPDPQSPEKLGSRVDGSAVGTIQTDGQTCGAYGLHIDFGDDGIYVVLACTCDRSDRTDMVPGRTCKVAVVCILYRGFLLMGTFRTIR